MKKIIVVGVGAQGSTIAKRMDEHPDVSEIICADYDIKAAEKLSSALKKASALGLDAKDLNSVIQAAAGCDLIVNGLPLQYDLLIMEAALAVDASYIDMAGPMEDIGFVESYKLLFSEWHEKFKAKFGFPFELIADPDETICNRFGVMKDKNMYGKKVRGIERSTFLVDEEGVLLKEWRKVKVEGHAQEVLDSLAEFA